MNCEACLPEKVPAVVHLNHGVHYCQDHAREYYARRSVARKLQAVSSIEASRPKDYTGPNLFVDLE